ncbi:NDMA-dependent alcohol dehydrogenase [Pseudonocardia sp. SCN 73-27]|uniref:NDMA-dependent alcohol dehydrogenase n=1 Tax=Pseudonocardia sp. SCN 73-27 TaxID=1660132 RepID=UPI003453A074
MIGVKTRGAVLRKAPGAYEVVELDLAEPLQGELMMKMVGSGLCHTDDHVATGDMPYGIHPVCGGHEGAGIVTQVGPHTAGWAEGDHVVFSFLPVCGKCRWCAHGMQNLRDRGAGLLTGGRLTDPPTYRMSLEGRHVGQFFDLATFSEYTTVDVDNAVEVPADAPLETVCLLGCGAGTGWGSAVNSANPYPGDTVIVMGVGGIGMNAVQGAVQTGAGNIIAVDPVAFKRETAKQFGATHTTESIDEATDLAKQFTNGLGADATIVTVDVTRPAHVAQAFDSIRKAETVVVTGVGNANDLDLTLSIFEMTTYQKRLQGSLFGASNPTADIPWLLETCREGLLKLDELVTSRYQVDEINRGYADMHAGKDIRGVLDFGQ